MIQVRRAIFLKAADVVRERAAEFTQLLVEETTSSQPFAAFNISLTISWRVSARRPVYHIFARGNSI